MECIDNNKKKIYKFNRLVYLKYYHLAYQFYQSYVAARLKDQR